MDINEEDWNGDCDKSKGNDFESQERESINMTISQVIPGYANFDDYLQEAFDTIRAGIKAGNNFPAGSNYNYYKCFPSFNTARERYVKSLLKIMQNVLGTAGIGNVMSKRDLEEKFELLLETNDIFLDRANACMDEESGVRKNREIDSIVTEKKRETINGSWNNETGRKKTDGFQSMRSVVAIRNVDKPQFLFKDKIDNRSDPWYPRIKSKPNCLKPLAIYIEDGEVFNHPYEFELDKFVPPDDQLLKKEVIRYKSLEETQLIMIENSADLEILIKDLDKYNEIAIDLEHHSYRTFQGITCLMQISTADTDYLVDALKLRSELHKLNEIFTKPSILKVFHGADSDILWLQRDLSLYVVNMFDTHQAAKQLNMPYLSLAYLLKRYCQIDPNKHFQLADWRVRPLPEELLKYAREDTHYLIYIKDNLRNALIDLANGKTNILRAVYDESTEICKKTYVKPICREDSYLNMYRKSQKMFNNKQVYALKELYKWRDAIAREEDESTAYVLPNHMLLNVAETLPREMQGILACCNPIPPLVRQNLLKLHKIILKSREQPLVKPILEDDIRQRLTQRSQITSSPTDAWIYVPHDIPNGTEPRADLPCLLDKQQDDRLQLLLLNNVAENTVVTAFCSSSEINDRERQNKNQDEDEDEDEDKEEIDKRKEKKKFIFVSPFERYKRVLPMVAEQEAQEREKERKKEEEEKVKNQEEIENSKTRVYNHLKNVTVEIRNSRENATLSELHGRKRKRESSDGPTLTTNIKREGGNATKSRVKEEEEEEEEKVQTIVRNVDVVKPIRQKCKGEKKTNRRDLKEKGMLPSETFDYKLVNFSSFQGGSTNVPNQVKFQDKQKKKREKTRKRKKQKLNI